MTSEKSTGSDLSPTAHAQPGGAARGALRSGKPACPYELRLIALTLFTKPSTIPLLQVMLHPFATASASAASPSTNAINSAIPLTRTAIFHCSKRSSPSRWRSRRPKSCASVNALATVASLWMSCSKKAVCSGVRLCRGRTIISAVLRAEGGFSRMTVCARDWMCSMRTE